MRGAIEPVDLALALRHGFGTFPGAALTEDLSLHAGSSLDRPGSAAGVAGAGAL